MAMRENTLPQTPQQSLSGGLAMVMDFSVLKQRLAQLQQFVKEYMVPGEDYGIIEGTGSKPTLLKPGAEKLCDVYGLAAGEAQIEFTRDDTKIPVYISYRVSLPLISRMDGRIIMVGVGSANSWEKKYRWRWMFENELPTGLSTQGLHTRQVGKQKQYTQYRVPNDEIDDMDNTLLKMAKKRALVDAVLSATRSSSLFTQDIEDMGPMAVQQRDTTERDDQRRATPPQNKNTATDSQMNFLQKKAKEHGLEGSDLDDWVVEQVGHHMEELTKKEASQLIDSVGSYKPNTGGGHANATPRFEDDPFADQSVLDINDADLPF